MTAHTPDAGAVQQAVAALQELYELTRWIIKEGAPDLEIPPSLSGLRDGSDCMGRARMLLEGERGVTATTQSRTRTSTMNTLYFAHVTYGMPRSRTFLSVRRLMLTAPNQTSAKASAIAATDEWIVAAGVIPRGQKARAVQLRPICTTPETVSPREVCGTGLAAGL